MISKYIDENILLIPEPLYKDKDEYQFVWIIDDEITLTGYNATYSFGIPGTHKVLSRFTNTTNSFVYENVEYFNIIQPERYFSSLATSEQHLGFGLDPFSTSTFGI